MMNWKIEITGEDGVSTEAQARAFVASLVGSGSKSVRACLIPAGAPVVDLLAPVVADAEGSAPPPPPPPRAQ